MHKKYLASIIKKMVKNKIARRYSRYSKFLHRLNLPNLREKKLYCYCFQKLVIPFQVSEQILFKSVTILFFESINQSEVFDFKIIYFELFFQIIKEKTRLGLIFI